MLRKKFIPKCEKVIADGETNVPVCILRDPTYLLLSFAMTECPKGGKNDQQKFFGYKLSSAKIFAENAFGQPKGRFCCLNRATDLNVKELPNLIMSCFVLHNFLNLELRSFPNKIVQPDYQRIK